jgi:hypothetical protein
MNLALTCFRISMSKEKKKKEEKAEHVSNECFYDSHPPAGAAPAFFFFPLDDGMELRWPNRRLRSAPPRNMSQDYY